MTNRFELLVGATAFMKTLRETLETCQTSLYVQFSTFEGDESGQDFAHLLIEKAKQGVDVRLILDHYSDVIVNDVLPIMIHRRAEVEAERRQTQSLLQTLVQLGVKLQRTAPPGFMNRFILYRDHKKIIIVDEKIAFIGGINVSDHNYQWHDFMVQVSGDLVKPLSQDYLSTWQGQTISLDTPHPRGDFVLNQCAGRYPIWDQIYHLLDQAQQSIVIESPYLLGNRIELALLAAAQRGVEITIIMPYHNNKLLYRIWVKALQKRLDHANVAIYGFRGKNDMTHAKLLLVDGQWVSFGSLNMFELEGMTQKELNIFSDNPDLIRQLSAFIEHDIAQSVRLAPPRISWGRFSYNWLYLFFRWWTNRLLKNPNWRAKYC